MIALSQSQDGVPTGQCRIAFISGPADARAKHHEWSSGRGNSYFGTDYFKQFLQLAKDIGAKSYILTWYGDTSERFQLEDAFTIDNQPITTAGGPRYYMDQLAWHVRVLMKLIAFRPNVLLLTGNQNFWWMLAPLRLFGASIIVSYHAVVWMKLRRPSLAWRLLLQLNRFFILRPAVAIVVTSNDIERQVQHLLGRAAAKVRIVHHLPTYSREQFAGIPPPDCRRDDPFRINFTSRLVKNKGVYDVIELARWLEAVRPARFRFDICGDGEELSGMQERVAELGLQNLFVFHGFCDMRRLQAVLSATDVCIVPTRSDCEAGFEMTCAEAILAGRPLVTSAVCPALEYVQAAAVEAEPENVASYGDAILKLADDPVFYESKQQACAILQDQFYEEAHGWYAAMKQAFSFVPACAQRDS